MLIKGRAIFRVWVINVTWRSWTHHVDDLRAGVSVLLHGLAGAVVLSFTHQQHLLWVVHRQAHLHMFNTSFYFVEGESADSNK